MYDAGYKWLVLDVSSRPAVVSSSSQDCWHPTRGADGVLVPLKSSFPNGMKPVIDYVHSKGLKFGLYTSVGTLTCRNNPGSYGFYKQDANLFASWGVDYVKMDWCGDHRTPEGHKEFSKYLNMTGRPIVLELCRGSYEKEHNWGYAPQVAQLWRATDDHHDNWASTLFEIAAVEGKSKWSGPYGWAYLDMIMTGGQGCKGQSADQALHCPGQTDNEYRSEFSFFAIVSSPILIGTDIRNMTAIMNELILNTEVLSVNQDKSTPGDVKYVCNGKSKIYVRNLSDGRIAVVAPNLNSSTSTVSICLSDLGLSGKFLVRDLWKRTTLGVFSTTYTTTLGAHDSTFLTFTKIPE